MATQKKKPVISPLSKRAPGVAPLLDTRPDILAVDEVDHVCNVWALKAELADSPH